MLSGIEHPYSGKFITQIAHLLDKALKLGMHMLSNNKLCRKEHEQLQKPPTEMCLLDRLKLPPNFSKLSQVRRSF